MYEKECNNTEIKPKILKKNNKEVNVLAKIACPQKSTVEQNINPIYINQ
jgi:hypothetical protein